MLKKLQSGAVPETPFTHAEIESVLKDFNSGKASGQDNMEGEHFMHGAEKSFVLSTYMAISTRHGICYHFYADDSQRYLAFKLRDEDEARIQLDECICDIRNWMRKNHLTLNDVKMEFIIIGYNTELCHMSGNDGIKIGVYHQGIFIGEEYWFHL